MQAVAFFRAEFERGVLDQRSRGRGELELGIEGLRLLGLLQLGARLDELLTLGGEERLVLLGLGLLLILRALAALPVEGLKLRNGALPTILLGEVLDGIGVALR